MTHHDKARELVERGLAVLGPHDDMPECVQRNLMVYVNMWQFREMLDTITAQAEENRRLREALVDCTIMLLELREESEREISYGEEDPFRMGEWFDAEMLMRIHNARAALSITGENG